MTVPTGADAYCPACAIDLRVEFRRGLDELDRYLSVWAAFDDWVRARAIREE